MSIDQSPASVPSFVLSRLFRPSHRTLPEQLVGLGLYLLLCLSVEFLGGGTFSSLEIFLHTLYFLSLGFSMWTVWRRYSLRRLKWELSAFLSQFVLQAAWSLTFFTFHKMLLALSLLLLLWSNTLLTGLLFWKKEKLAGSLLLFPIVWIFYWIGVNMVICISNP